MVEIFLRSILQAALCFISIAALRFAIVYLGTRIGAILMGAPMIMFPMLAIQAWYGPAITQRQTFGSIGSNVAVACALWALRLPLSFNPFSALLTVAGVWLMMITLIYVSVLPAEIMTAIVIANALFIVIVYRNYRPVVVQTRGNLVDGAVPIAIFLVTFFLATQFIPDFARGVFVSFPIGLLATIYFIRRILTQDGFKSFTVYMHGAVGAGAIFVIVLHFTLLHLPIALSLATALAASLMTLTLVARIWRAPIANI